MNKIKTTTYTYDFLNPTSEDNPLGAFAPSFRGENQMIIYTRDFPLMSKNHLTNTNPWGFEAAVNQHNVVIDINDRVKIPINGYVISGNSKAADFIKENILLGSNVILNTKEKTITIKTNIRKSLIMTYKNKEKEIQNRYQKALKEYYFIDIPKIEKHLKIDKENYIKLKNTKNISLFKKIYSKAIKNLDYLYLLTSNSLRISSRNAWMRPGEQNLQEIIDLLDLCKKVHINGLYVESFYNGNIPGISKITDTSEEVRNCYYGEKYQNDYLKALISEAHKRHIEIHAWVECFFVGEKSSQWKKTYKDSWHMVNYDHSTIQGNNDEHNEMDFVWLDPANPECLQYVLSIYQELLENYDFDGINVDYVRYPHGNLNLYSSNGYSEYAMNEFKKINNLQGDVFELVKDSKINKLWIKYRCDKITLLMQEIRKLVNRVRPNCLISTSVCSDLNYAINNKMQNWKIWARNNYLDLTFPMAYYIGCSEIAVATKELVDFNRQNAFSYTGIMCMSPDLPADLAVQQINTLFANKADGYALFSLYDLQNRKEIQKNLKLSTNRLASVHPHQNYHILFNYYCKSLKERTKIIGEKEIIDNIVSTLKSIHTNDLLKVKEKLLELAHSLNDKILQKEIKQLIHFITVQSKFKLHRSFH